MSLGQVNFVPELAAAVGLVPAFKTVVVIPPTNQFRYAIFTTILTQQARLLLVVEYITTCTDTSVDIVVMT
jgi:hypothetical protein